MRGQAVRQAPALCMTATTTSAEIQELKLNMGLRDVNTVVLRADPVQSQFNIVKIYPFKSCFRKWLKVPN